MTCAKRLGQGCMRDEVGKRLSNRFGKPSSAQSSLDLDLGRVLYFTSFYSLLE